MTSVLASGVKVTLDKLPKADRRSRSTAGELPHALDVALHLLHELIGGLESHFVSKTLAEREPQRLAVEIALEVEQIGLYEQFPGLLERRAHADADRRIVSPRLPGVDPGRGDERHRLGNDVRGRHAQVTSAGIALDDRALELERSTEELARGRHVALLDQPPDPARRDGLAPQFEQWYDSGVEGGARAQQLRIAARAVAEAEVLPDADVARVQGAGEHVPAEGLRLEAGELRGERDHDQLVDAELAHAIDL